MLQYRVRVLWDFLCSDGVRGSSWTGHEYYIPLSYSGCALYWMSCGYETLLGPCPLDSLGIIVLCIKI